jgi:predicted DNA-binding protein (UPF0251 family)
MHIETMRGHRRPETPIEALMMAGIGEDTVESVIELQPMREAVAQCIEQLDEQDQFIVNAVNSEMISYEELGQRLGVSKPHAWRLKNAAYEKLKHLLTMHPIIRRRVQVASTWNESAAQWVDHLSSMSKNPQQMNVESIARLRDIGAQTVQEETLSPIFWTSIASSAINELKYLRKWDNDDMVNLLGRKQNDYGHGNIEKFGHFGILVRLSDKIERLRNLKKRQAQAEPYEDALVDIVGYCVVALMLDDNTFGLELGDDFIENLANNRGF